MNCGIYQILNKLNGKFYIGSSSDIVKRCKHHVWYLENNEHLNTYLQNSWNKYSLLAFDFIIIELCSELELLIREQYYLDTLMPAYNVLKIAGSTLGSKRSDETKAKMSAWQIGRKMSDEAKDKMREMARNYDKWPCIDGKFCKCDVCLPKMREYNRLKAREYRAR